MEITNVLWIDPEIDNEEFRQYEQELETNKTLKVLDLSDNNIEDLYLLYDVLKFNSSIKYFTCYNIYFSNYKVTIANNK